AGSTPDGRLVAVDGGTCRPLACGTMLAWLEGGDATLGSPEPIGDPGPVLPRAWAFLDGSAYVNHVALVRKARGAEMPARFWTDPLMYQGCAAPFLAPDAPIPAGAGWGTDFEAEVAVILSAVPRGAGRAEAQASIRAVTLLNDVSLRGLIPDELSKGFGFVQSKPPSALAPFAVTPQALSGWDGGRLAATMCVDLNGAPFGRTRAETDMTFDFPDLIVHAARTRDLPAGTVIGSGTVSNGDADDPGRPVAEGGRGYSCIAEQRMVETILGGAARTPFLSPGDRVEIWMEDDAGRDLFGRIAQEVIGA
ncbi:MAG: fumarylacetoacetate hydrolase family protein, partial [Pseudomonadota bacterium]